MKKFEKEKKRYDKHIIQLFIIWDNKKLIKKRLRWEKELRNRTLKNMLAWIIMVTMIPTIIYTISLYKINEDRFEIIPNEKILIWKIIATIFSLLLLFCFRKTMWGTTKIDDIDESTEDDFFDKFNP